MQDIIICDETEGKDIVVCPEEPIENIQICTGCSELTITGPAIVGVGSVYVAAGGVEPYSFSFNYGTISSAGVILTLENCTLPGNPNPLITVTDSCTSPGPQTAQLRARHTNAVLKSYWVDALGEQPYPATGPTVYTVLFGTSFPCEDLMQCFSGLRWHNGEAFFGALGGWEVNVTDPDFPLNYMQPYGLPLATRSAYCHGFRPGCQQYLSYVLPHLSEYRRHYDGLLSTTGNPGELLAYIHYRWECP